MIIWLLACAHPVIPQLSTVPTDPPLPVTALVVEITNIGSWWGQCHIARIATAAPPVPKFHA